MVACWANHRRQGASVLLDADLVCHRSEKAKFGEIVLVDLVQENWKLCGAGYAGVLSSLIRHRDYQAFRKFYGTHIRVEDQARCPSTFTGTDRTEYDSTIRRRFAVAVVPCVEQRSLHLPNLAMLRQPHPNCRAQNGRLGLAVGPPSGIHPLSQGL